MINIIKGILIGIANIIPGVSGGSFALILGIYTRLIDSLSKLSFKLLVPSRFKKEFKRVDGLFLIQIFTGSIIAIAGLARVMDYLLKFYPAPTLAFFAGLILVSIAIPYKMVENKKFKNIVYILPGFLAVVGIYRFWTLKAGGELSLGLVFISAAIGISAMVLPGISGSFILLILGVYEPIVGHVKNFVSLPPDLNSLPVLIVFGLGCIGGILFFVRIMKYLLHKKRDKTLAFLVGLVAGSLVVLWPFKAYPDTAVVDKVDIAIITSKNVLPGSLGNALYYLLFFTAGIVSAKGIKLLEKIDNN
ncbi:MAG: DUF368 domain-containing protein [Elusimicrobiota bacterium]